MPHYLPHWGVWTTNPHVLPPWELLNWIIIFHWVMTCKVSFIVCVCVVFFTLNPFWKSNLSPQTWLNRLKLIVSPTLTSPLLVAHINIYTKLDVKYFWRDWTHLHSLDSSNEECSTQRCEIKLNSSCYGAACSLFSHCSRDSFHIYL